MTGEEGKEDPYADLRAEFSAQVAEVKASFDAELADLKSANEKLASENADLKRSLVRSTVFSPQPEAQPELTEEQKYAARIDALSKRSFEIMKELGQ